MKHYLIDTQILLFSLIHPEKLPKRILNILKNEDNLIFTSSISFWEISLKYSLKKLYIKNLLPEQIPEIVEKSGFTILSPSPNIFATFYKLPSLTKDPFDKLLVWQAINSHLTFITLDKELHIYKKIGLKIIA